MKIIIYTFFTFFLLQNSVYADQMSISFLEPPTSSSISIKAEFQFDDFSNIYYWQTHKSMHPIIGSGLFVTCIKVDDEKLIRLRPKQKKQPKVVPHKKDMIRVTQYNEVFNLEPKNMKYENMPLKTGNYTVKITYDTRELKSYPEGKGLTEKFIRSNELKFTIK